MRLLLAEDNPDHAELVRRALLREPEFELSIVSDLAGARSAAAELRPDFVLSDLQLPDGTAIELLEGGGGDAPFPLIVMTGQGDEHLAVACIKAGALDYLVKSPETLRQLPHIIRRSRREWELKSEHRRMQAELAASEHKFRTLVENVPGVVIRRVAGTPHRVLYASHGIQALTGHAPSEFEGERGLAWGALVLPDDLPRMEARLRTMLGQDRPYELEYRIRTRAGLVRTVFERGLRSSAGSTGPDCVDGVLVDVTDRRAAEQALHVSEERLRLAMEASSDGHWDCDLGTGMLYWSARAYTMLGYRPSEFTLDFDGWKALMHPDDVGKAIPEIWRQIESDGHYSVEYRLRTGTGGWRWINDRGKPVAWDSEGRMTRLVGTHVDIDHRVQAERRLQESKQRFEALFEHANDAILVFDPDTGRILSANSTAGLLLGREAAALTGLDSVQLMPPELRDRAGEGLLEAGMKAGGARRNTELLHSDGRRIQVEASFSLVELPQGERLLQGIFRDLSEQRQLEAQLRQAQKMEAIGQLAGGVAHDFNNVLAAIMLQLSMLQADRRLPADMQSTLTILESSTKRAADLTRQLLLFGRRQPAKMQPVDLDALIANLLKMLRRLIGESIRLDFVPQSPGRWLHADPGMIEQVLMNLVVNARDAMPRGGLIEIGIVTRAASELGPRIRTEITGESATPLFLELSVRDNGHGMDQEVLKRIFEPFFTTKQLGKGTGLGLATAYSIIKQHRGWIEAESSPGKGACFRIFLPQVPAPVVLPRHAETVHIHPRGRGTILLVEDDNIVRTFTSLSLRSSGFSVLEAKDGRDAGVIWEDNGKRIDYLLTDMVMPNGVSGWDLISRCRASAPGLAVVLMSGYPTDLPKAAFDPASRVFFLQKPFDATKLNQSLKSAQEQIEAGRAAASEPSP
jgi:PAS domain S-box-containing protein